MLVQILAGVAVLAVMITVIANRERIRAWLGRRYASYTPDGKFWLIVGTALLAVDMAIGFLAGFTVTFWHGLGYSGLALFFAFLPDAAYEEFEHRRYISAAFMALLCLPVGIQAYQQQLTYSAGMRTGDIQQTAVTNTRYDDARRTVKDGEALLQVLNNNLAELEAAHPWTATVTATGLRAELESAQKAIDLEAARGGCKAKCLAEMQKKADLEKRIALAEKSEDLGKRIAATKRAIAEARGDSEKKEFRSSVVANIAATNAQLWKMITGASAEEAFRPDEVTTSYANLGSAGLGSFALLIGTPMAFFLAGRRRIVAAPAPVIPAAASVPAVAVPAPKHVAPVAPAVSPLMPAHSETTGIYLVNDDEAARLKKAIREAIGGFMPARMPRTA